MAEKHSLSGRVEIKLSAFLRDPGDRAVGFRRISRSELTELSPAGSVAAETIAGRVAAVYHDIFEVPPVTANSLGMFRLSLADFAGPAGKSVPSLDPEGLRVKVLMIRNLSPLSGGTRIKSAAGVLLNRFPRSLRMVRGFVGQPPTDPFELVLSYSTPSTGVGTFQEIPPGGAMLKTWPQGSAIIADGSSDEIVMWAWPSNGVEGGQDFGDNGHVRVEVLAVYG